MENIILIQAKKRDFSKYGFLRQIVPCLLKRQTAAAAEFDMCGIDASASRTKPFSLVRSVLLYVWRKVTNRLRSKAWCGCDT